MTSIEFGNYLEANTHAYGIDLDEDGTRRRNAHHFVSEGFKVLPLRPNGKEPMAGSHGYRDASSDPETVEAWFDENPGCNFGVVPPAGMFALDIDPRNGGNASFETLKVRIGALPDTVTVSTGGGGSHYYYRLPADAHSTKLPGKLAGFDGIDIKGANGYLVGPGSIHPNGTPYRFADGLGIDEVPFATAPEELVALLTKARGFGATASVVSSGSWNPTRSSNLENLADFDAIVAGCGWAQRFFRCPEAIMEPEWALFAMMSSHCLEGHRVFHEASKLDRTRYDFRDAEAKFDHVVHSGYKPPTCAAVQDVAGGEGCARCPFDGTIKSPIKLGFAVPKLIDLQRTYIFASAPERYFNISAKPFAVLTTKGFSDTYAHLGLDKSAHDILKTSDRTVKVHNVRYFPGNGDLIVSEGGLKYLNTYENTGCVATPGSFDRILDHLAYLVPDETERNHILDGFASLVQNPSRKIRHIWVIIGGQGTGKGFFTRISQLMFGKRNVGEAAARDLNARFKGHLVDMQVLILGEMMTDDRRDTYNENKELFSEDTISVEDKGLPFRIGNTPRLIIGTSNHDRPTSGESRRERRLFVVKSPAEVRDPGYYRELYEDVLPSEASAFKHMLSMRDLSAFSPDAPPPMTVAKEQLLFESMSQLAQVFSDAIEAKERGFEKDLVNIEALAARYSFDFANQGRRYNSNEVRNALLESAAVRFFDGRPITVGEGTKKRFWVVRNFEKWRTATSEDARHHLNS